MYRWGRCLFHQAHEGTLAAEVVISLGGAAAAQCRGESGASEAAQGAAEIGYTSGTSSSVSDALLDRSVMHCIQICAGGERCGLPPSDFFGGCGSPPNRTARPRAFQ